MDLFTRSYPSTHNHLPCDGEVYCHGELFTAEQSDRLYQRLLDDTPWQRDEALIYGKHIITERRVAWYADTQMQYHYSGITRSSLPWSEVLLAVKQRLERKLNKSYNACLLNLYPSGDQGMAWHRDNEVELIKHGSIASLSLGATRRFLLRHNNSQQICELPLEHGELIEMCGVTQDYWQHSIPKMRRVSEPRINLTFRQMKLPN